MKLLTGMLLNLAIYLYIVNLWITLVQSQGLVAIDLGATYTKVAAIRIGKLMEIVLDFDSNRKTLGGIGFKDGYLIFGEAAINLYRRLPGAVVFDINTLLGARYSSLAAQNYRLKYPHLKMSEDPSTGGILIHPAKYDHSFTVIELFALKMHETIAYSKSFMSYDVKDVVICMPPNTHQAQLSDVKAALRLLNISYIGFVDSSTAIATQYIITRRTFLNDTKKTIMIIDIGSHKSLATLAKIGFEKNSTKKASVPYVNITGIGYINKGVSLINICLRDLLIEQFQKKYNIAEKLSEIPKVEFKFHQEAVSLKHLLTGNKEVHVTIEDAYQDRSFNTMVDRSMMDTKCAAHYDTIVSVVELALKSAKETSENVDEVVLMGGGSFMPEIKRQISVKLGKETLSKVLNTDDSVALGASFIAADMSRLFKVAPIHRVASIYYSIKLDYDTTQIDEQGKEKREHNTDILYNHMSRIGAKRVLNLKNQTCDFNITVSYLNLEHALIENEDNIPIMEISVHNLTEVIASQTSFDSSHVSLHFRFNPDGLIDLYKVQIHFAKNDTSGIFTKVGQAISDFFKPPKNETENEGSDVAEVVNATTLNDTNSTAQNQTKPEVKPTSAEPKKTSIDVDLNFSIKILYLPPPDELQMNISTIKLVEIFNKEKHKKENAKARSDLESFIYQVDVFISGGVFESVSSPEEYEQLKNTLTEQKNWLDEFGMNAEAAEIKPKMASLTTPINTFKERIKEREEIPKAVENFEKIVNATMESINGALHSKELVELINVTIAFQIMSYVNETQHWLAEKLEEQKALKPSDKPALTSWLINYKAQTLQERSLELFTQLQAKMKKAKKAASSKSDKKTPPTQSNETSIPNDQAEVNKENTTIPIEEDNVPDITTEVDEPKNTEQPYTTEEILKDSTKSLTDENIEKDDKTMGETENKRNEL